MIHLFYQEYILNKSVHIPETKEIDWELFIQDENERNLTKEIYDEISTTKQWNDIDEYINKNLDIPDKILKNIYAISKRGIEDKYLKYNHPTVFEELFESEDMVRVSFIGFGLAFFFVKGVFQYFNN